MRIVEKLSQHRFDFTAIIECEHCGDRRTLRSGYDDANYHERVIPAMTCALCKKNRAGVVPEQLNQDGMVHVPPSKE